MKTRSLALLSVLGLAVIVGGLLLPQWMSYLFTIAMGKGLVVLGLVLLMRAGLVSFGQGLYYCVGAYVAGMLTQFADVTDILVIMLASVAVSVAIAAIIGLLLCRYREIFFAMFSMAFSMILYGLLVRNQFLGSTDGFNVANPSLLGWTPGAGCSGNPCNHAWNRCMAVPEIAFRLRRRSRQRKRNPVGVLGRLCVPRGVCEVHNRGGFGGYWWHHYRFGKRSR